MFLIINFIISAIIFIMRRQLVTHLNNIVLLFSQKEYIVTVLTNDQIYKNLKF